MYISIYSILWILFVGKGVSATISSVKYTRKKDTVFSGGTVIKTYQDVSNIRCLTLCSRHQESSLPCNLVQITSTGECSFLSLQGLLFPVFSPPGIHSYVLNDCPDGYPLLPTGTCLMLAQTKMEWLVAAEYCNTKGGTLLRVRNSGESYDVSKYLVSKGITSFIWLYISDRQVESQWRWGIHGPLMTYTAWDREEPNNHNNLEHCGALYPNKYDKWNDWVCSNLANVVCQYS